MKRSAHILPVLIAAVITFASLFALAGSIHFGRQNQPHCLQQQLNKKGKQQLNNNKKTIMNGRCNTAGFGPAHGRHHGFYGGGRAFHGGYKRPKYNVPVNIAETDTAYSVSVYATGFEKENIKLSVVEDVLFISGTRTVDESSLPNFIQQEFPIKSFEKRIELNGQIDTASISAKQENTVLVVTLPKTKEAQQPAQDIKVS